MKTSPARVVLVDDQNKSTTRKQQPSSMHEKLCATGFFVLDVVNEIDGLVSIVTRLKPDVLILSTEEVGKKTLEELRNLHRLNPAPVLICAQKYTNDTLPVLLSAGVDGFVFDDVAAVKLPMLIDLAIARFTQLQSLNSQLQKTQEQLSERKLVEKAKGVLMQQKGLSEADAYAHMRRSAMNQGQSMAALSKQIIAVFELLE